MKIKLDPGAFMPEYAHERDAGMDLRSPVNAVVLPHDSAIIHTGIHSKKVRKCIAYGGLHSQKADWAKRWPACGLYGKVVQGQMVSDTEKQRFARQGIRCDSDRRQVDGQIGMEEAGCAK